MGLHCYVFYHAGTKAAMDEQLRLGQELRQKMQSMHSSGEDEGSDSDGGGSTDASSASGEEDEGAGRKAMARTRAAALDILAGVCYGVQRICFGSGKYFMGLVNMLEWSSC